MIAKEKEERLNVLRESVRGRMSPKRFAHTIEVEKMAALLASLYLPEEDFSIRAAALLHDIAKETEISRQVLFCEEQGEHIPVFELFCPKTIHARTGALLIPILYPEFADELIISAVRWHTTGREGMSLADKIIYLADYIDYSRTFPDCVKLREYFFSREPEKMDTQSRLKHLDRTLLESFDMTVSDLLRNRLCISEDTIAARNSLILSKRS